MNLVFAKKVAFKQLPEGHFFLQIIGLQAFVQFDNDIEKE